MVAEVLLNVKVVVAIKGPRVLGSLKCRVYVIRLSYTA